jgi:peptidoglycan/LPS O-acetylase OafA/YrhL
VEGLRAVAATSIVIVHVWAFSTPNGAGLSVSPWIDDALSTLSVGVTLFFTLSGFLLYRPFAAAIARGVPRPPIRTYLRNRFLRIAPAYWVILLLTALVIGSVNVRNEGMFGVGRLTHPLALLQSALLLQDYRPTTMVIGIGPAWSLAVEVVFYCVLPLLVLVAARFARRARSRDQRVLVLIGPPLLLLAIGLSGKYAAHLLPGSPTAGYGSNWHSVIERSFWAQADLFSFGMLVAIVRTEVVDGRLSLPTYWRRVAIGLALLVFVPCAWTMHQGEQSYLLQNTGEALGIALAFATVMIPGPGTRPLRVVRLLESRPLVATGVVSYSIFLWHHPIIVWLERHGLAVTGWGDLLVNLIVVSVVVGVLSALTYRFVERPALRRKSPTRPTTAAAGDVRSALGGAPTVGVAVIAHNTERIV